MDITLFVYCSAIAIAVLLNIACIIWPEAMIRFNEYWHNLVGLKTQKDSPLRSPAMTRVLGLFSLIIILALTIIYILDSRGWK